MCNAILLKSQYARTSPLIVPGASAKIGSDAGYELQVLDSYNNKTYVNGQAGSIYKQGIPLVNPNRKPGAWQAYDVVWTAPIFNVGGSLKTPAYVTVLFNGVLVQNHFELKGETQCSIRIGRVK